jgi:hypothetical protein
VTVTSANALQAALAQWTDEVFLECLTFDHSSISTPIRLVNDQSDLSRTAGTFTAFPFSVKLHARGEDRLAEAEITATNVDRRIVEELRAISDRPTCTYEVVLHSSPNTVEVGPIEFAVLSFVADAASVGLRCAFALDFLNESWPKDWIAPWNSADS